MITVKDFENPSDSHNMDVSDLTHDNYSDEKNAFIGRCGDGPYNELYIIAYDNIILARNPRRNWSSPCNVSVVRFVDIDILVKDRAKKETKQ